MNERWQELVEWMSDNVPRLKTLAISVTLVGLISWGLYEKLAVPPEWVGPQPEAGKRAVILLHGHGASKEDLVPLAEELTKIAPDVSFVMLQAPHRVGGGFTWYPSFRVPRKEDVEPQVRAHRAEARAVVVVAIDELRSDGVTDGDIFVGGFSQGATVAMDVFMNEEAAKNIGGILSLSGGALELDYTSLNNRAPPRTFLSHGTQDPVLPVRKTQEIVEILENSGEEVRYIEFDGSHTIPPEVVQALGEFLAE